MRADRFALSLILALAPMAAVAQDTTPDDRIAAALADDRRPAEERERDTARHAAETLALADIQPGDQVADMVMGGGYFTRLFASLVGDEGLVWAWQPQEFVSFNAEYGHNVIDIDETYRNVAGVIMPFRLFSLPAGEIDVAFTAQNYHDFHLNPFPEDTAARVNAAVFTALRPCGRYVVIDHDAAAGSGFSVAHTLHRAEARAVQAEIAAAGFELVDSDDFLHRDSDPLTANVFDPSIRGNTSQFVLVFRKPGPTCPAG